MMPAGTRADFGSAIRRARGDVIEETRPDPTDPGTVLRGARVRDTMREMWQRGRIGDAQFLAVQAFRDDAALVQGGGVGVSRLHAGRGGGAAAGWLPGDALLAAAMRVRLAWNALGRDAGELVRLVVLNGLTIAEAGKRRRRAKAATAEGLRDALDVLAVCYDTARRC